jgi:arginine decarboxylase
MEMSQKYQIADVGNYYFVSNYRLFLWRELRSKVSKYNQAETPVEKDKEELKKLLAELSELEMFWGFPGRAFMVDLQSRLQRNEVKALFSDITVCLRAFTSMEFRKNSNFAFRAPTKRTPPESEVTKNYFEVLFVDDIKEKDQSDISDILWKHGNSQKDSFYRTVFATSFEDALTAVLFNPLLQSVVLRYNISKRKAKVSDRTYNLFLEGIDPKIFETKRKDDLLFELAERIKMLRPELAIYLVTDLSLREMKAKAFNIFNRIFYRLEDIQELHICILEDIRSRNQTHFFTALKEYSQKPTGVFHAMPISRGNSVFKSWWMRDFGDFYGRNLFLAETSSTSGGLDSLSQPTGPLKKAQEMAAAAYGAKKTFFVTNGTSTSNKIIHQGLTVPGDIVLIDRECHKSHHYALVLSGAIPVYLDSYKVNPYSIYGAVTIKTILSKLEELENSGRLCKVKMLVLTNCTFDGIVYNPLMVMEAVLKVKRDMIFLWDEAWFGFASFSPYLRSRTAMYSAKTLEQKKKTDPNLKNIRVRVYATQSTHKTLSSFRQGSVIHTYDEDFDKKAANPFHEAYLTHISTSPNYQILASLDAGRKQAEFEGFELTESAMEMGLQLRYQIFINPKLKKYFHVLPPRELIPNENRENPDKGFLNDNNSWARQGESWANDEFALDPTKVSLCVGKTGVDGNTFRNTYLMDQFGIQVNKTSPNTVLFMTNIGTTRSSVSYLLSVLLEIAEKIEHDEYSANPETQKMTASKAVSLMSSAAPLPSFTGFHNSFRAQAGVSGGNIREAYYLSYDEENCEYKLLDDCKSALENEEVLVSTNFVTPYPPGFPVLVPGQVLSLEIINFLLGLDVKEIHGYDPSIGLRLFTEKVLTRHHIPTAFGRRDQTKKD